MSDELQHLKKTDLGIEVCYTAPLAYVFGWISGAALLLLERNNRYVRFHAAQSVVWFGGLSLAGAILGVLPLLSVLAALVIGPVVLLSWILLVYRAWFDSRTSEPLRLPMVADLADRLLVVLDG
jgi:uncharacterized membrane protein